MKNFLIIFIVLLGLNLKGQAIQLKNAEFPSSNNPMPTIYCDNGTEWVSFDLVVDNGKDINNNEILEFYAGPNPLTEEFHYLEIGFDLFNLKLKNNDLKLITGSFLDYFEVFNYQYDPLDPRITFFVFKVTKNIPKGSYNIKIPVTVVNNMVYNATYDQNKIWCKGIVNSLEPKVKENYTFVDEDFFTYTKSCAPNLVNDNYSTNAGTPVNVNTLLSNDTKIDALDGAIVVGTPAHGTITYDANNIPIYTPAAGYKGTDSFPYSYCNDKSAIYDMPGDTGESCSTATVYINIESVICYKDGATGTGTESKFGVSTLNRNTLIDTSKWTEGVNNGALVLDSKTKGFVITRMTTTEISSLTAVKGMIVFDTTANCLKMYTGSSWDCIQQTCID